MIGSNSQISVLKNSHFHFGRDFYSSSFTSSIAS